MPNLPFLVAALLVFTIGLAHSWIGERRLIGPLLSPEWRSGILAKSEFARRTLRFAWHITSLAWWGMGAALIVIAILPTDRSTVFFAAITGITFLITGLITLITSRGRHLAWPVFLTIAALCFAPLV